MVSRLNNPNVSKRLVDLAKINIATDTVADQIAEKIVPVLEVSPDIHMQGAKISCIDATAATVHTASTTKRTFVTNCSISVEKTAGNGSTLANIVFSDKYGGTAGAFIELYLTPSTATNNWATIAFPIPIEIAKGSIVKINNLDATASIDISGNIQYYEVED